MKTKGENPGQEKLENAYRLDTPEDNIEYYRDFAATYDSDFAEGLGYIMPDTVAKVYRENATDTDVPIADIGCGTGLVGAGLAPLVIDGMDISAQMLAVAKNRGRYRDLIELDLTGDLRALEKSYGAVVSAGTFTHGHLGPNVLINLLAIARDGALFVIGVNKAHFRSKGFEVALQQLEETGQIGPVAIRDVPIYSVSGHPHSHDRALVVVWRVRKSPGQTP